MLQRCKDFPYLEAFPRGNRFCSPQRILFDILKTCWLQLDVFLLPIYVATANRNPNRLRSIRIERESRVIPQISSERLFGQFIVAFWFSFLTLGVVPCKCEGKWSAFLPCLCSVSSATGVYLVGTVGLERVNWFWAFAGSSIALPSFLSGNTWQGITLSCVAAVATANWFSRDWKYDFSLSLLFAIGLPTFTTALTLHAAYVLWKEEQFLCCPVVHVYDARYAFHNFSFEAPVHKDSAEIAWLKYMTTAEEQWR